MTLRATLFALCLSVWIARAPVGATSAHPADPCQPMPLASHTSTISALPPPETGLILASLNIAGRARIEGPLTKWILDRGADVVLLQEVGSRELDGAAFTASVAGRLEYSFVYAPADRLENGATQGLAILSREPLEQERMVPLQHHQLRFKSRCRIALAASVSTGEGHVQIANVHLDTRINSKDRVAQLAPVMDALDDLAAPQVVGGDFNTMDVGWFHTMWPFPYFQHQVTAVRAMMADNAFHTPFDGGRATFKLLGLPIRLDWVYLKSLHATDWGVDDVPYSDHRGVWTRVSR